MNNRGREIYDYCDLYDSAMCDGRKSDGKNWGGSNVGRSMRGLTSE